MSKLTSKTAGRGNLGGYVVLYSYISALRTYVVDGCSVKVAVLISGSVKQGIHEMRRDGGPRLCSAAIDGRPRS